jgi:acyl-CoA synthetase (AMP-forming)/AMP-acid ligase II
MNPTLTTLVEESAKKFFKQRAVIVPELDKHLTFGELHSQITFLKNKFISWGLKNGDVSVLVIPNGLEFVITFLAVTTARGQSF